MFLFLKEDKIGIKFQNNFLVHTLLIQYSVHGGREFGQDSSSGFDKGHVHDIHFLTFFGFIGPENKYFQQKFKINFFNDQ